MFKYLGSFSNFAKNEKKDSTKKAEETFFFLLSIENQVHKSAESLLLFKIGSIFQR